MPFAQDATADIQPVKKQTKRTTTKKASTAPVPITTATATETSIDMASVEENNIQIQIQTQAQPDVGQPEECVKKRGRKPQGGKIIKKTKATEQPEEIRSNVILHLKCFIKDLETDVLSDTSNIWLICRLNMINEHKN